MRNERGPIRCRKCGSEVAIIQERIYRKIIVDAEAVRVVADPEGEEYIRIDGSKVRGRTVTEDAGGAEYAYTPHARSCGAER